MPPRLSLATLRQLDPTFAPPVDPRALSVGVVHLGLGAFARAHGLVFSQAAIAATGESGWGYCGVTQRSAAVLDQLAPQDGLYTVLVRSGSTATPGVVATARELLFAGDSAEALTDRLAAATTRLVTLTVTEKGYRHDPATGRLRRTDPGIVADAAGRSPVTVAGQLVRGLAARRATDAGPISLLSCDNLSGNGEVLRAVVLGFCELLPDDGLASWIADNVAFPSSMVDRMVPATTDADRKETASLLGLDDEGVVVAEPFSQWVVQDTFAAGRPAWHLVGATLTADVVPYERMKLRLLNASHSTIAYLGALAGYTYIAQAVGDPAISAVVDHLMAADMTPTLAVPDGFDVVAYQGQLRERFANSALLHTTRQIAMDGSQKLPVRLLSAIRERLAVGAPAGDDARSRGLDALRVSRNSRRRFSLTVDDPLAARLREAVGGASSPAEVVTALVGVTEIFGDLGDDSVFRSLVTGHLDTLTRHGALAAARAVG